ncbi:RNA polymerase II-associated protein rba50 [Ceratobasidium sp. AG-Ba]|nr:RNA polymerase II-associated protein rba50 [Ceratobasidium sp. AG-Ba]
MSFIGSVVERTPTAGDTSQTPFPVSADPKTGFPAATHRQVRKSAFRQNMEAARPVPPRDAAIPIVQPTASGSDAGWRTAMEAENAHRVANMSPQEREQELRTIQSRFGDMAELAEVLKRAKDLRNRADNKRPTSPTIEEVSDEDAKIPARAFVMSSPSPSSPIPTHRVASPARPILSRRSSVSGPGGSRAGTPGVRFAEVTPRDVFTYPSAPASPKRTALMIEAPPAESTGDNIPKLQWHGKLPEIEPKVEPEEPKVEAESTPAIPDEEMPALVPASTTNVASEPKPESLAEPETKAHPLSQVVSVSPPPSPPKRSPSPPELKLTLPTPTSSTLPPASQVIFPSSNQVAFPTMSPATPAADSFDPAAARLSIASQLSTGSDASRYTSSSETSMPRLTQFANASTASLIPPGSPISIDLEPSTPEAIRLQYFPDEPEAKDVPALQWMMDAVDLPEIPDTDPVDEDDEDVTIGLGLDVMQQVEAAQEDAAMKDGQEVEVKETPSEEETTPTRDTFGQSEKTQVPDQVPSGDAEKETLRVRFQEQDTLRSQSDEKVSLLSQDGPRFNLAGTPIPYDKAKDLPVHDGLHHNSRTSAGYTLNELLHLARSTAPMQRAMALDALARLTTRVGRGDREVCKWFPRTPSGGKQGRLAVSELRKRVLECACVALGERGAVGTRAVDCVHAALVVWDWKLAKIGDVELSLRGPEAASNAHVMPSDYVVSVRKEVGAAEMDVVDDLAISGILDHATKQFKARWLPKSVLRRLLGIIVRLARQSRAHASVIMDSPELVPEIMRTFILSGSPYPDASADPTNQPDVLAIRLLIILAQSSRQNASALLDPTDTLLRFVAVLPPADGSPDLLIATLDLYAALGRYGMYAHIATTAASSFDALSQYVRTRRDPRLTKSWMRLRAVWTACATDPHHTTPAHEILWSQVQGWGWGADALALCRDEETPAEVLPDVWVAIAVWLEGASVNGVKGGEAEKAEAMAALKTSFTEGKSKEIVQAATSRLMSLFGSEKLEIQAMEGVAADADALCAALRLDLALIPTTFGGDELSGSPLELSHHDVFALVQKVALHRIWDMVYSDRTISPYAYTRLASLALCLGYYLVLAWRIKILESEEWLKLAFIILQRLPPPCAENAAQIIREVGVVGTHTPSLNHISEHLRPNSWDALLPFLLHDLQPDAEQIVSPMLPSPTALSRSATQIMPSRPNLISKRFGLPARTDWTMQPLNHLLRSGVSPVFKALPEGWDSDEVDVVRTTLSLTCAREHVILSPPGLRLSGAEIVFGCMRVFMLEHGQPHDDSSSEIFRDIHVDSLMRTLLSIVSLGATKDSKQIEPSPLEIAAGPHLSNQPFYQFYTDLIALYDAVSFAHPTFSRILLPPLSMNYAIDYRRHFWGDYGHIIRSVQTELPDVPSGSLKEWLWPRDTNEEMIGWYLKALMKGGVTGFLRFVAVHHLATSLWPDLNGVDDPKSPASLGPNPQDMDRTRIVIGAIVHQAGPALFSAIALYDQGQDVIVTYPECWEGRSLTIERRKRRLDWAVSLCGERVRGRLEFVFNS